MRKIKFILLILLVFIITGCSGNYNLTFNKDLSVEEELNILIDNKDDAYEKTYSLFENAEIDTDKYEILIVDDKVKIKYKEKYSTFGDYYLNSKLYKTLFDDIEYTLDNKGITISAKNSLKLDDQNNQNIINSYDIENLNINISTPFYINKSNADSIKDNTYTWSLNSNDTYKNINLDFSYRQDRLYGIIMLTIIGVASLATIIYIATYLYRNRRI